MLDFGVRPFAAASHAGVFDVRDYGAVVNGGTDDTTAIQNCINAAQAVNGTVQLGLGTSLIGSSLIVSAGVRIQGYSATGSILKASSTLSGPVVFARYDAAMSAELRWVTLTQLAVDGNKAVATNSKGIRFGRCVLSVIEHCFIHDSADYGVSLDGSGPDHSYYNSIRRCNITNNATQGITSPAGELNFIYDNAIDFSGQEGVRCGALYRVYGNIIGNNNVNVFSDSTKVYIGFNHMEYATQWAIQLAGGAAYNIIDSNLIDNNSAAGSNQYSDLLYEGQYHIFSGNTFDSVLAKYCIQEWQSGGIAGDTLISNNRFKSFVTDALFVPGGVNGGGANEVDNNQPATKNESLDRTVLIPQGSKSIPAGFSSIAVRSYKIASGTKMIIGSGSRFRVL